MKISAIVLAAGSGSRMQSSKKKQFMEIKGKPLVWYSLFAFEKYGVDEIILVTGSEDIDFCKKEIVEKYNFTKVKDIVAGGKERYESVYNGLKHISGDIVLIHDGARPVLTNEIIERGINGAIKDNACVVGVPVKDTIKIVNENNEVVDTPNRNTLWITQTPQCFKATMIKEAYQKVMALNAENITDDAMVMEQFGHAKVKFVEGDYKNIKVTTPEDISVVESFLQD